MPALLEQGVALLEGSRVPPPQPHEVWFHVEQTPIEEPPTGLTAATDQCMATRFEGHHRQRRTEGAELGDILAVQAAFPFLPTVAEPGLAPRRGFGAFALLIPFHKDIQRLPALAHQPIPHPATETAPVRHDMQRL